MSGEWLPSWYGTRAGWCLNLRNFTWELHDGRGAAVGYITCQVAAECAREPWFQPTVTRKFGVPFPVDEVPAHPR
jgi:hypothetical protein